MRKVCANSSCGLFVSQNTEFCSQHTSSLLQSMVDYVPLSFAVPVGAQFVPFTENMQKNQCAILNLQFVSYFYPENAKSSLLSPDFTSIPVPGDNNCLFTSFSQILTGSTVNGFRLRTTICGKLKEVESLLPSFHLQPFNSADAYLKATRMAHNFTWGTSLEILVFCELCFCEVNVFNNLGEWEFYRPLTPGPVDFSCYLEHVNNNHFNPIYFASKKQNPPRDFDIASKIFNTPKSRAQPKTPSGIFSTAIESTRRPLSTGIFSAFFAFTNSHIYFGKG